MPSRTKIGMHFSTCVASDASRQPAKLASIRAEDTNELGSKACIHDRFGGALCGRFIGRHHETGNDAVGELEQVGFAAAIFPMNHINGTKAQLGLGEHREVVKGEGIQHYGSLGACCT